MTSENTAIHHAQLTDMPLAAIVEYLRQRGYAVVPSAPDLPTRMVLCDNVRRIYDRSPPGYPPMGDDDVPFDGEDKRG